MKNKKVVYLQVSRKNFQKLENGKIVKIEFMPTGLNHSFHSSTIKKFKDCTIIASYSYSYYEPIELFHYKVLDSKVCSDEIYFEIKK